MRGFLTAILLSGLAGVLFASGSNSPLLTDGPVMTSQELAEADIAATPAPSVAR